MISLTEKEATVIRAYKEDDFVNDKGFESPESCTWVKDSHRACKMSGKEFSGVISSLVKKGIVKTDGETWSLTSEGIEVARELSDEKTSKKCDYCGDDGFVGDFKCPRCG